MPRAEGIGEEKKSLKVNKSQVWCALVVPAIQEAEEFKFSLKDNTQHDPVRETNKQKNPATKREHPRGQ